MNNLESDVEEVSAGRPPTACPCCELTAVEVRAIYALLIDRFEHLDIVLRSTPSQPTKEQAEAEKLNIETAIKKLCS